MSQEYGEKNRIIFTDINIKYPGKVFPIEELGVNATIGGREALRGAGPIGRYDLLKAAEKKGIEPFELLKILSNQLAIYNRSRENSAFQGGDESGSDMSSSFRGKPCSLEREERHRSKQETDYPINPEVKDYLLASKLLFIGKGKIPFSVGLTTTAIMRYGLKSNIDPRVFSQGLITNDIGMELEHLHEKRIEVSDKYLESVRRSPAVLTGSSLVVLRDNYGNQSILMRRRTKEGIYQGSWSIPGGHSDRVEEPAGLEELEEETNIPSWRFKEAVPLGVADNIILYRYGGSKEDVGFSHYLNYVWYLRLQEADLGNDLPSYLQSGDEGEDWFPVPDYMAVSLADKGGVTPIAKCAMQMAGF